MNSARSRSISRSARLICATVLLATLAAYPSSAAVDGHRLFSAGRPFFDGQQIFSLVSADVNGDPYPDLVLSQYFQPPNYIVVFLGREDGTFESVTSPIDSFAWHLTVGDLNDDGYADVVWPADAGVKVLLGRGDGTFDPSVHYPGSIDDDEPVVCADADGDGDLDIFALSHPGLTVLENAGDGTFIVHEPHATGLSSQIAMTAGDFNGDGFADAAITTYYYDEYTERYFGRTYVLVGLGDYTFGEPTEYGDGNGTRFFITNGDMNGDGHLDLVCSWYWGGWEPDERALEFRAGRGDGTFEDRLIISTVENPRRIVIVDFNEDGRDDLAVVGDYETQFLVRNTGAGFSSVDKLWFTDPGESVALADFDGDGDVDAAMAANNMLTLYSGYGGAHFAAESGERTWLLIPLDVAAGDFNGDGIPDVAAAGAYYNPPSGDGGVTLSIGQGDWSYVESEYHELSVSCTALTAIDVDNDGDLDLAVVSEEENSLIVMYGQGDGTFQAFPLFLDTGGEPIDVLAADLVGDADIDLVTADNFDDGISVFTGRGTMGFEPAVAFPAGYSPGSLAAEDLDGDGDLDLVVGQHGGGFTAVLLNNGDDTFAAPVLYASGDGTRDVVVADFDEDGIPDLAVANNVGQSVALLPGLGDGTFGETSFKPISYAGQSIAAGDMDRNGTADLVVTTGKGLTFIPGNGDGSLGQPVDYCSVSLLSAQIHDMDLDGGLDVVAVYNDDGKICLIEGFGNAGLVATGPGPGEDNPPLVRLFHPGLPGHWTAQWQAYGVSRYGVNVALGNLEGGLDTEVVTGAGPGAVFGPHVRGFSAEGTPLTGFSFFAYGTHKFGVNVACGDIDGDGFDEVVTGAGPGEVFGPHVRGWNRDETGTVQSIPGVSFLAYGTNKYGVNVTCGDIDGDGIDEIVTGAGPGAVFGPHVRGWDWDGAGTVQPITGVSFLAYGTNRYGVIAACGDIDGDGIDEIVTGPGPSGLFSSNVRAWNWDGSGTTEAIDGVNFIAFGPARWGVNVAAGDLDGDGIDEIVTGRGPEVDAPATVRCWNYDGLTVTHLPEMEFLAYDSGSTGYGVKVALRN